MSLICPMDVAAFPFDTHICILKFSSFARSPFLESSIPLKSDTLRKSDEMTFVRTSGTDEQPDDRLDQGRVQDFAVNASYIKVSRFSGVSPGYRVSGYTSRSVSFQMCPKDTPKTRTNPR